MADELKKVEEFSDKAEKEIESRTGIKGSEGSWASRHPGVIIAMVIIVGILLVMFSAGQ